MHHTLCICLRAWIKSIIIFASWCMHHWVGIMAIASCHMHHFICAWNIPSLYCTSIAIMHLKSASLSWLSSMCTMSWNLLSLSLGVVIFLYHKNHVLWKKKSWARMFQKLLLNHSSILCLFAIDKPCDESHRHLFSSCCDLSFVRTWLPCLIIIPCSVYLFLLDLKTLHDSIIRPGLRAMSESSLGACLKASLSSRGGEQETI